MPRRTPFMFRLQRKTGWMVVRRIHLNLGVYLEPGNRVPDSFKEFRLRVWHTRGLIGLIGDQWTKDTLALTRKRLGMTDEQEWPQSTEIQAAEPPSPIEPLEPLETAEPVEPAEAADPVETPTAEPDAETRKTTAKKRRAAKKGTRQKAS